MWYGMAVMALVAGLGTALVGVRGRRLGLPGWLGYVVLGAGSLLSLVGLVMLVRGTP